MDSFEVTLTGDWAKTQRIMSSMPKFISVLRKRIVQVLASRYYDALKHHLESQDLPLAPLNDWYRQWKEKHGLDSRILIATGELMDNIKIYDIAIGKAFIGIKGGKQHKGGIDMALLALIHEYGSVERGMPARPLYRLTFEELKSQLNTVLQAVVIEVKQEVFV